MQNKLIKIDIGCGENKHNGCIGIDIDRESNADIIASALELPLNDASVDEVYSSHLVEHFLPEDAQKFFDEVYRVLRPEGVANIKIDREWSEKRLFTKDNTHKYRYTAKEIKTMVKKFSKSKIKSKLFFLGFREHIKNFSFPNRKIFVWLKK